MSVRAKFKVDSVTKREGNVGDITLFPVCADSPENKEFYQYTPSGKIELSTVNPMAIDQFKPGDEVYVDFTPVTQTTVETERESETP